MEQQRFYGSDPEYFIYMKKKETDFGTIPIIVPPAALFADMGVKFTTSPNGKRVLLEEADYRFIEDGAALELNFKRPLANSQDINNILYSALDNIDYKLRHINYELKISKDVLGYFSVIKYWKNRDKSFTDCVRFGCDPDQFPELYIINGFEEENCKIIDASKHNYRYAGGHLHVQNMSKDSDVYYRYMELAPIVFDFIVGTTNILFQRDNKILTQEKARLIYYGRPGRIRLQKYSDTVNGIEYRPPSNQWINNGYNVNSMLYSADIAASIIEDNGAPKFFSAFQDRVFDMWKALTNHDRAKSKNLLLDSLSWALDNHYITIFQLEKIYGQL